MTTKTAENGRTLKPHNHVTEWSVCGKCGTMIDWASDTVAAGQDPDDTACPHCGHPDTAWLYADVPAEREAYQWASDHQGYHGTWEEWQEMDADTRHQYELGAAGIPTD